MVHMVYQINEWSLQLTDDRGLRCQHALGGVPGKARALPAQSSKPRSWQSRAPMVLGLQGHTGLCWAGKEQMENGTLWPGESVEEPGFELGTQAWLGFSSWTLGCKKIEVEASAK